MARSVYNVLFLCTHNSARSVLAESLLNHDAGERFRAFSAGSHPSGALNPYVIEFLLEHDFPIENLRSKAWEEFAEPGAPNIDLVITVCDQAVGEICPVWPGRPVSAHWGVEDPSTYKDDPERAREVVRTVAKILKRRIELLVSLPLPSLERLALERRVREIGRTA